MKPMINLPFILTLCFTVLISIFIIEIIALKRKNLKGYILPYALLTLSVFLVIYIKLTGGDILVVLLTFVLGIISSLWIIIRLSIDIVKKRINKQKIIGNVICIVLIAVSVAFPTLENIDRYKLYKKAYSEIAYAMFEQYDKSMLDEKSLFIIKYDEDELKTIVSNEVVKNMKVLDNQIGVWKIIVDENAVYFFFSTMFQSVDGIAITRNLDDSNLDDKFLDRFMQSPSFKQIEDNVFYFEGGV